jgi:DNA-binding NarL/FixJ family response regulator
MTAPSEIKMVVVDDQDAIRTAIIDLLNDVDEIDVVGQAVNGEHALEVVAATAPDVVLMDLRMPLMNGVEATRRLAQAHPEIAVVIHTAHDDDALVIDALVAGARGYLLKGSDPDSFVKAIRNVAAGQTHLAGEVTRPLVDRLVNALNSERRTRFAAEEATRRLEVVNARQREFAVMSSHELRTPLTLLRVSLEALDDLHPDHEEKRRILQRTAMEGARRLHRLVENLEVAADVDALELKLESVDISILSPELVADLSLPSGRVQTVVPAGLYAISDRRRLRQVIDNLVSNALNASPNRDGVVIGARAEAGQVVIDVCDRGAGFEAIADFDPDILTRVVPFSLRPSASGGLGLGLWVADELVTAMGGHIVARNNPDGGATVSLYLQQAA